MPASRTAAIILAAGLVSAAACQTTPTITDGQANLEQSLRRACVERLGGPRADAVDLFAGRLHTACFRWAHRQARRAGPH